MKRSHLVGALGAMLSTVITVSAHAALIGVLPATSGGTDYQAYYDTDLDITWLADANLAASNTFGIGTASINSFGVMHWDTANTWIANMNTSGYLGFNDWRLPTTQQPDPSCSIQAGTPPQGFGTG